MSHEFFLEPPSSGSSRQHVSANPELCNMVSLASHLTQDIQFSPSETEITKDLPHPSIYMESGDLGFCSLAWGKCFNCLTISLGGKHNLNPHI